LTTPTSPKVVRLAKVLTKSFDVTKNRRSSLLRGSASSDDEVVPDDSGASGV
jgi:hypothetical protein